MSKSSKRSISRLHLGDDDAILPSIHAIFQSRISEGTGSHPFPGWPVRALELARLLGIVLRKEMGLA